VEKNEKKLKSKKSGMLRSIGKEKKKRKAAEERICGKERL